MKFKDALTYLKKIPKNSISIFLFHGIINKNLKISKLEILKKKKMKVYIISNRGFYPINIKK